jgi:perosamine synthetase
MTLKNYRYRLADPELDHGEMENLSLCIAEGMISSQGRFVAQFESEFSAACGAEYGVAVANGTCALHLALAALGIGPGDEVIVPSLTFIATANAVRHAGATPVFADIDPETLCLTAETIEPRITAESRAIIPVHLLGQPCDMPPICRLAGRHSLDVVEDAAEAHGAEVHGQRVGSFGDINCFSFYANKIITTGEGGMCTTNDAALARRMRVLRDHGMDAKRKYWHNMIGYNYRLTNLQAALGVAQLPHLGQWVEKRRWIFSRYRELLAPFENEIYFLRESSGTRSACWMSSLMLRDADSRDALVEYLCGQGIEARPLFWPVHLMPPYRASHHGGTNAALPVTEDLSRRGVLLPSHTKLTDSDLKNICDSIAVGIAMSKDSMQSFAHR